MNNNMNNQYYASSDGSWRYLGLDADPPSGKIHVLTEGGVSIPGTKNTKGMIAWAPLMVRDKLKERIQLIYKDDAELMKKAAEVAVKHRHHVDSMIDSQLMAFIARELILNEANRNDSFQNISVPKGVIDVYLQVQKTGGDKEECTVNHPADYGCKLHEALDFASIKSVSDCDSKTALVNVVDNSSNATGIILGEIHQDGVITKYIVGHGDGFIGRGGGNSINADTSMVFRVGPVTKE